MRVSENWIDYELIDATDGMRLERWKDIILIRPDPQVVWKTPKANALWHRAHAVYMRSSEGGGHWDIKRRFNEKWHIEYADFKMKVSPTGFKHTGIFPEQAVNWDAYTHIIKNALDGGKKQVKVLNLFGYTGGATLACAAAGASVCHVDASKGMVAWGRENSADSGLSDKPIRWIVDDCAKFVAREIRRGSKYDGVIMDPPSYGRGPGGEVWKLEDNIYDLLDLCKDVLVDNPLFFAVNSYTSGVSPCVMQYMLNGLLKSKHGGHTSTDEIGLKVTSTGGALPCGATTWWLSDKASLPE